MIFVYFVWTDYGILVGLWHVTGTSGPLRDNTRRCYLIINPFENFEVIFGP